MRFLFVHRNFPGQFLHIVRHLVAMPNNDVVFITEPNANIIKGVRKVAYGKPRPVAPQTHIVARELDTAARRAEIVANTANSLKSLGFVPDLVMGHHGWGEMLNLQDVFPNVPAIGYFEFYYQISDSDVTFDPEFPIALSDLPRIRAKNAVNHIALSLDGHGVTPTKWQMSTYPEWAQARLDLLWEGVNIDVCSPHEAPRVVPLRIGNSTILHTDKLVTYVSRDLEPYRGVHTMIRALPALLQARKDLKVVMLGGDGVSYGTLAPDCRPWRELFLKEVSERIDLNRVAFPGRVDYATYLELLRRSDAHVYLTYPFVASWSLREALAVGCAIIGSDTEPVREFITHNENGLLTSFFDPQGLANSVLKVLEDKRLSQKIRRGARRYAEAHLAMDDYLYACTRKIETLTGSLLKCP